MKGRLIDFSIGWNRKQRITIEIDSDFREGFDALKGADIEISVKSGAESVPTMQMLTFMFW